MIVANKQFTAQLRILFCIVLFEYIFFIFSGVGFSFLHGDRFFNLGVDPASWVIYGLNIPQYLTTHHWLGIILDSSAIIFLLLFIRNPFNRWFALLLLILLFLFYMTLSGYHTHRNFQVGFVIVFFPFIFKKNINKYFAYEACRYFILIFYVSAALLKLSGNALSNTDHFSHMLSSQFTPYFLESNTGFRTDLNLYLIHHPGIAYALYFASFIIELSAVIGFFTKRYDVLLAILLLGFHFMSWLIMDIAALGHLGFISLLFLSRQVSTRFDGNG